MRAGERILGIEMCSTLKAQVYPNWLYLNLPSFSWNLVTYFLLYMGYSDAKNWGIFNIYDIVILLFFIVCICSLLFFFFCYLTLLSKSLRILLWSLTSQVPLLGIYSEEIIKTTDNDIFSRLFLRKTFTIVKSGKKNLQSPTTGE